MALLKFRSPVTLPLHRADWVRPPGVFEFKVTQSFGSLDGYFAGRAHGAVDIGNFRCNDPIVAMAPGTVRRVKDGAAAAGLAATDALGVVIDHGWGLSTEYWHLNGWVGPASGHVEAGQQIGILGSTGIGAVCHCHIEAKRNGVRFDPEPLMFGGSVETGEVDVEFVPATKFWATGVVGADNRLRPLNGGVEGSTILPAATTVGIIGVWRDGPTYTLGTKTDNDWYTVVWNGRAWLCAKLLVTNITATPDLFSQVPLPDADCSHEVAAATDAARQAEAQRWRAWIGSAPK